MTEKLVGEKLFKKHMLDLRKRVKTLEQENTELKQVIQDSATFQEIQEVQNSISRISARVASFPHPSRMNKVQSRVKIMWVVFVILAVMFVLRVLGYFLMEVANIMAIIRQQ